MMRKTFMIIAALLMSGMAGCSRQNASPAKSETTKIELQSMVCGSCAKTIKQTLATLDGVEEVDVDLKAKIATVKYEPSKIDLPKIETAIANAGYDANKTKRNPDAYDKLDACCKIDG